MTAVTKEMESPSAPNGEQWRLSPGRRAMKRGLAKAMDGFHFTPLSETGRHM